MEAAPHHDMTSLPMHTSHTGSSPSSFMQLAVASNASSAAHAEGTAANVQLPSVTEVKIITSSSFSAGGSYGNNGLAPTESTVSAAVSFGNNGQAVAYTHAGAGASYGNNGLTLTPGPWPAPEDAGGCTTAINNDGKTSASGSSALTKSPPTTHIEDIRIPHSLELKPLKKPVKYRECLKNHAASLGGHANDGCGEFMPSGEEGTIEALKCAACSCHRNFHRKEVEGEVYAGNCECRYGGRDSKRIIEPLFTSPLPLPLLPPPGLRMLPRGVLPSSQMIMAFNSHDSDEYEGGILSQQLSLKKRFRTKFTQEQREQMGVFAEKLGWRIQKHDEAAVQQFCAEVGVKRHVLKVWMHNNKHALGKKLLTQGSIDMGTQEELRS